MEHFGSKSLDKESPRVFKAKTRLLIVDGNEQESRELVHLFESLGQEASATWSGRDALGQLVSKRFDFLLVDQLVADMYVGDFIERVLRIANHPRVAVMKSGGKCKSIKYDKSLGECRVFEKGKSDQMPQALRAAFPDLCNAPLN
jgi:DNA-binding NtrC family response regulator